MGERARDTVQSLNGSNQRCGRFLSRVREKSGERFAVHVCWSLAVLNKGTSIVYIYIIFFCYC